MVGDPSTSNPSRIEIACILVENQKENNEFVRHYEDVRFKITQVIVTLAALLVGASGVTQLHPHRLSFALFIVGLGVTGVLISVKYTERADRHATLSRAFRRAASDLIGPFGDHDLETVHLEAARMHGEGRGLTALFRSIRARYFWIAIHACIIVLGIFVFWL